MKREDTPEGRIRSIHLKDRLALLPPPAGVTMRTEHYARLRQALSSECKLLHDEIEGVKREASYG
jgi:hypothetical protein